MATIFLVRHGKAAAGFDAHHDPGLDALGRSQAEATARLLAPLGPFSLYSSPLARARETSVPLATRWGIEAVIEPRVAEIPSPMTDLAQRSRWLAGVMQGRWRELPSELRFWRRALVDCLLEIPDDSVVFCHFVAINVAVGEARNDDRLVSFRPDNGSVTRITNADRRLRIIELGQESISTVG